MADEERRIGQRMRFFVLSCRDPRTDFRGPLVGALREQFDTWYIFLKRRPQVSGPDGIAAPVEMSFFSFLRWFRAAVADGNGADVFFNSTNTAFPLVIPLLRLIAARGIWCMDMHDDLLYDTVGWKRLRNAAAIRIQTGIAHLTVHSAESLAELFPRSRHLGNASHIKPISRPHPDFRHVLILASLDQRFDFELAEASARLCPDTQFHIHGQVSLDEPGIRATLERLVSDNANIVYHGAYILSDLDDILQSYPVSFAPYRTNLRLTRYIDPLRFYHCLNSGMELIATPIPQAEAMRSCLHLVRTPQEFAAALADLPQRCRNTGDAYHPTYWNARAARLVNLLSDVAGTRASQQAGA